MTPFHKVGKIKDAFGIQGDLYILIFSGDISWYKKIKSFSIGPTETFEVERVRPHKEGLVVHCVGMNDRNQAELLKGRDFCIDPKLLISQKGEDIFLAEIAGFFVFEVTADQTQNSVGVIESFSSNGVQDLLVVRRADGKTSEIPFVKDFIQEIKFEEKEIYLTLPDGLLEIND